MTDSNNQKDLSRVLWSNAQINQLSFVDKDFTPSNRGHGLFVKTFGKDVLYDLRFAREKPFWGHTHPLVTQHNFKNLKNPLEMHYYSVPKTEYIRIIETFQKVHFTDLLEDDFKITYHNIVINFDESMVDYDFNIIKNKVQGLIEENPETFFWLIEKDVILFSDKEPFNFFDLMQSDHVHICLDFHFINSVFIYSHHLFSEDDNIQLFLGLKKMFQEVISTKIAGKNTIDHEIIDDFINQNNSLGLRRQGRYVIADKTISKQILNENGIIYTESIIPGKTIFAFPLACTNNELKDVLERIKKSI